MQLISRNTAARFGLPRYFTGVPCARGHRGERSVSNRGCIICALDRDRSRYRPEAAQAARQANLETKRSIARESARRRRTDPKILRQQAADARRRRALGLNPPETKAQKQRRHQREQQYRASEKGKRSKTANSSARRSLTVMGSRAFTAEDWRKLVDRSPSCHWCKRQFNRRRRPTHDHVIPLTKGGRNTLDNSCCACASCNPRKGARLINPVTGQGILL